MIKMAPKRSVLLALLLSGSLLLPSVGMAGPDWYPTCDVFRDQVEKTFNYPASTDPKTGCVSGNSAYEMFVSDFLFGWTEGATTCWMGRGRNKPFEEGISELFWNFITMAGSCEFAGSEECNGMGIYDAADLSLRYPKCTEFEPWRDVCEVFKNDRSCADLPCEEKVKCYAAKLERRLPPNLSVLRATKFPDRYMEVPYDFNRIPRIEPLHAECGLSVAVAEETPVTPEVALYKIDWWSKFTRDIAVELPPDGWHAFYIKDSGIFKKVDDVKPLLNKPEGSLYMIGSDDGDKWSGPITLRGISLIGERSLVAKCDLVDTLKSPDYRCDAPCGPLKAAEIGGGSDTEAVPLEGAGFLDRLRRVLR